MEIAHDRVAAARWTHGNSLDGFAVEALPPGALIPSAVEANVVNPAALKSATAGGLSRLRAKAEDVPLLLPDPLLRVFLQHFDQFPPPPQPPTPTLPSTL